MGFFLISLTIRESELCGLSDPDGMSQSRKEEFLTWYDEKVSQWYIFNFQHELLTYCQSGVRLLEQGCMTIQSQFKVIVSFNPMQECIAIASACDVAYQKKWMPKDKIAVEPVQTRSVYEFSRMFFSWMSQMFLKPSDKTCHSL